MVAATDSCFGVVKRQCLPLTGLLPRLDLMAFLGLISMA